MSKRSQNFKNTNKFNKDLNLKKENIINSKCNEYSILANLFCNILGLTKNELKQFIKNGIIPNFRKNYILVTKSAFEDMKMSLNKAYKAGEDKEHERHVKEEDEAFKRGVNYGREQRENEIKVKTKDPDNWIERERKKYSDPPNWLEEERKKYSDPPDWYRKEQEKYSDFYNILNEKNQKLFNDFRNHFTSPELIKTPEDGIFSTILINRMFDLLKELQK